LSGCIIAYAGEVGRPERIMNYLYARLVRIYPTVWIVTLASLEIYGSGFGGEEKVAKFSTGNIIASALLLPQDGDPLVNVTWSLKYEAFFYLFSILLWRKSIGFSILVPWQAGTLLFYLLGVRAGWSWIAFYLRPISLEFGIEMLCARIVLNGTALRWPLGEEGRPVPHAFAWGIDFYCMCDLRSIPNA